MIDYGITLTCVFITQVAGDLLL